MADTRDRPFSNIESAHHYLTLLCEALDEAHRAVEDEAAAARATAGAERRVEAFSLVSYKMNQLRKHLLASLIVLNDLRTLRRLLLGERAAASDEEA